MRVQIFLLLIGVSAGSLLRGQTSTTSGPEMTNADVIALVASGISQEIIISKICAAPKTSFDTDVSGLKSLQAAQVPSAVIQSMINPVSAGPFRAVPKTAAPTKSNDPADPHSPGIYLYSGVSGNKILSELQQVTPKQMKHTGGLLRAATQGIMSSKGRAVIEGGHAPVSTEDPNPCFYLYDPTPEGSFGGSYFSPRSFTLVKFNQKNDSREIVESSFNIAGAKSGLEEKAKQSFNSEEVKPGVHKLTLTQPLSAGEYAFAQNSFQFFDFSILPSQSSEAIRR